MDIDALHSALLSLTVLPEQLRSARENVSLANGGAPSALAEFLNTAERDLRIAKATLARELGFPICACCWPPELLALDADGRTYCPVSTMPPVPTAHERTPSRASRVKRAKGTRLDSFVLGQKEKLLRLRDTVVDSISGVAKGNLRSRANGAAAASFVGDNADAGNDTSERDFALSLLTQEHDALSEIDQALKRIEDGVFGICEMSGQSIPRARLEAIPFARHTVECQTQLERQRKASRSRRPTLALDDVLRSNEEDARAEAPAKEPRTTLSERFVAFESAEAALHLQVVIG